MKRQINSIANALSLALFGKNRFLKIMEDDDYGQDSEQGFEGDILKIMLNNCLSNRDFQGGRSLIFEATRSKKNLILSLSFYDSVLKFTEEELNKNGFSKAEAEQDIKKLKEIYVVKNETDS
jgi:hypothetical protein